MKVEKIALEIATLKKQLGTTMPDVIKTKIEAKITRLEKELKGSSMTGVEFARNLLAGKKKVNAMSKTEFSDFVKLLSKKPEYEFLKYLTKQQIKDDLDRVAKPVGWRFAGRTNFAKPTKTDIRLRRNVYYENRSNKSDVSTVVRLATGGGISEYKVGDEKTIQHGPSMQEYIHFGVMVDGKHIADIVTSGKRTGYSIWDVKGTDFKYDIGKKYSSKNSALMAIKKYRENKMARGGAVGSTKLFDLEYGDVFQITRKDHTGSNNFFIFFDLDDKYNVSIKAKKFMGNLNDKKYFTYITDIKDGEIKIIDEKQVGEMLYKQFRMSNVFAKGGSLTDKQKNLDRNKNGIIDSEDLRMIRENKMAKGGMVKHGLKVGDEIISSEDNIVVVRNNSDMYEVNLNQGTRIGLAKSGENKGNFKMITRKRRSKTYGKSMEQGGEIGGFE